MIFELPEVEILRRDLDRDLPGRRIKTAEATSMKTLGRYRNRKAFSDQLLDAKILAVSRRGLMLLLGLDTGSTLVLGLGSSGSLRRTANREAMDGATELVITFTQHGQLRLLDTDGTAEAFVVANDVLDQELESLVGSGTDPLDEPISWTDFGRALLSRPGKLKTLLTDDSFIVGIGDLYADEILFDAGLRFDRTSTTLSSQEIRRLHRAVVGKLHDAIRYRGTSLPDRPFFDPAGEEGGFSEHLEVWGRHGASSSRSRQPIQRVKFGGGWTYYCETQV